MSNRLDLSPCQIGLSRSMLDFRLSILFLIEFAFAENIVEHTQAGSMQEETRLPPSRGVSYIPYHTIPSSIYQLFSFDLDF